MVYRGRYMNAGLLKGSTMNRSRIAATLAELGWHELADDVRHGVPIRSIEAKVAKRGEPGSAEGLAGEGEALVAAIEAGESV
jgi:hypothetical protein